MKCISNWTWDRITQSYITINNDVNITQFTLILINLHQHEYGHSNASEIRTMPPTIKINMLGQVKIL